MKTQSLTNAPFAWEILSEHTRLNFKLHYHPMIMPRIHTVSIQEILFWPDFITEGTPGLNFSANEDSKFSWKINENGTS